ncbi:uncharacterized protein MELLADRAFT_94239 [Melampsora larici-populina 98AG31]|uniref:Far11/STRP C-terminal domain-containing protein n=1 Tax=Melampsora larici-populina (strain 98AG31 / pathotype 3-4-7) TaxID=747676 RepID=F4S703_MELLP|nr:uncharacterized protein MELLADRAFT_94239 [Melampsora larici-populina 98AG31]EGF99548.1 hypothetical protein MELLADRAFT_94239 [Melampsora larici-populina 98AG31]
MISEDNQDSTLPSFNLSRSSDTLRLDTTLDHQSSSPASPYSPSPGSLTPLSAPPLLGTSQPYINPILLKRRSSSASSQSSHIPPKPWHGGPGQTTVSGGGGPQGRQITLGTTGGQNSTSGVAGGTGTVPQSEPMSPAANDSITLGQLKQMVKGVNRERQSVYDFPSLHPYPPHIAPPTNLSESPGVDSDTFINELDEFYSYVEVPGVLEGQEMWGDDCDGTSSPTCNPPNHKPGSTKSWSQWAKEKTQTAPPWTEAEPKLQKSYIIHLLDRLEDKDPEIRFDSARRILYIAQGTFSQSTSKNHHVHLIMHNVRVLREAGALEAVFAALKGVGGRHDWISSLPEAPESTAPASGSGPCLHPHDRQAFLEEINGELAIHLAVLYFMVEVFRGDDAWGEELMGLDPPLPIYMFGLVAGLREKNAKGYPVKKLLLLLWKSMLATLGGMRDVDRVKHMVRTIESLPPDGSTPASSFKVSPIDFHTFRKEILAKYPTYVSSDVSEVYLARIAAAAAPTPIRPSAMYHPGNPSIPHDPSAHTKMQGNHNLQPGTPAPSPPPSPQQKPKKQQFQTDQTRPFVLPFSPANAKLTSAGLPSLVPRSIDEAGELYRSHLRISTELWQTWKVREEFMADESGLARVEAAAEAKSQKYRERDSLQGVTNRLSTLSLEPTPASDNHVANESLIPDSLQMLIDLEAKIRCDVATAERLQDNSTSKKLKQDAMDTQRLQRVELIYVRSIFFILPQMQSAVIVLLKLLLATVTANTNPNNSHDAEQPAKPSPTIEDIDILRHREITSKAVSAILILSLKWFKTSHVMKFHYLAQLLVDSNCLLLILKMFGLQEVATQVKTKNECEDYNFFRYCALHGSRSSAQTHPDEEPMQQNISPIITKTTRAGDEEVELITDYSWRNFFAAINFVHILQKLTKGRIHRILLLVQYKSSAILKRILRANQPTLQLYVLKVIKSQIPYCGRKWRQGRLISNMKVITAIYLNCRADLRDEWLLGVDLDGDVEDSFPQEQALRSLVSFYNCKHYGAFAPHLYRRPSVMATDGAPNQLNAAWNPADRQGATGLIQSVALQNANDTDAFPPDYEVESLFYPHYSVNSHGLLERNDDATTSAWNRLGELLGDFEDISDTESIASIGYLGGEFGADGGNADTSDMTSLDEFKDGDHYSRRAEWEHLSPETITALEEERKTSEQLNQQGSPSQLPRRRKSSEQKSPALRPVVLDGREEEEDQTDDIDSEFGMSNTGSRDTNLITSPGGVSGSATTRSPHCSPHFGPQSPLSPVHHGGPAVDEVELIFGE